MAIHSARRGSARRGGGRSAAPPLVAGVLPRDAVLLGGLAVVVAAAAALRLPHLSAHLPALVHPDEPTVVGRALGVLDGQLVPPQFDWPPLSAYVMAAAVAVTGLVEPGLAADPGRLYLLGRLLFLAVAVTAVALTGLLGAALAERPGSGAARDGRWPVRTTAWVAAGAMAISYTSLRLSRIAHPEHLQIVWTLAALLATLAYDRCRRLRWLAAAGALAGLAGATKYLGVTVALPAAVAVWWWPGAPARRRGVHLALLAGSAAAAFVAGTLGTVLRGGRFVEGLLWQVGHQAGGHLGYEAAGPGWLFHFTTAMPGNWGWPLTLLAAGGSGWVAARGSRPQRLVALFAVALFVVIGASRVRFPHYLLIVYPELAALAAVALVHTVGGLARRGRLARGAGAVLATAVAGSALAAGLDDVRLLRASGSPDTRLLAAEAVATLDGPVWAEGHSVPDPPGVAVFSFGTTPQVLDCGCYAVVSSYQEQRYRRRPDLYRAESAVYERLRAQGRVVAVIAPAVPLSYRWDLLPQWGVGELPLSGPVGPTGPTITILDLRSPTGVVAGRRFPDREAVGD
ncbi:MAG TPA: phospholipid carrier-dependent glycosyltransferase [Egibacteraceae bacterium]|nr:phospholipid carrier-dependent glycosyltransferase [Egibacteraceae bacterium]